MSNSYVKHKEEIHIYRVAAMVESWEDPDVLIEQITYELWLGDVYICSFDSLADLIQYGGDYIDE